MNPPESLTLPDVAPLLRIGEKAAYDLGRTQWTPAAKVGGQWHIRRTDLDAWIAGGGEAAAATEGQAS